MRFPVGLTASQIHETMAYARMANNELRSVLWQVRSKDLAALKARHDQSAEKFVTDLTKHVSERILPRSGGKIDRGKLLLEEREYLYRAALLPELFRLLLGNLAEQLCKLLVRGGRRMRGILAFPLLLLALGGCAVRRAAGTRRRGHERGRGRRPCESQRDQQSPEERVRPIAPRARHGARLPQPRGESLSEQGARLPGETGSPCRTRGSVCPHPRRARSGRR